MINTKLSKFKRVVVLDTVLFYQKFLKKPVPAACGGGQEQNRKRNGSRAKNFLGVWGKGNFLPARRPPKKNLENFFFGFEHIALSWGLFHFFGNMI